MKKAATQGTFRLGEQTLNFKVLKNEKIKYYSLTFAPTQGLIIQVPKIPPQAEIETILKRHRRWIFNRLKKANLIKEKEKNFRFRDGDRLLVLNEKYRLSLKIRPEADMFWLQKDNVLEICLTENNQDWIAQVVVNWYRLQANNFLGRRLPFWAEKMGVKYNRVTVKNQKSLWGSCSRKRNLNFNWRILLLTPEAADYLIVHELAHLIELNHSKKFWNVVETYLPDYRIQKQQIKEKNHLLKFP